MDERREFTCKEKLRRELLEKRAAIADKLGFAARATERLLPLVGDSVMVYVAIGSELDTSQLIETLLSRGAAVYAPFTVGGVITPRRLIKTGRADRLGNLDGSCYAPTADGETPKVCVTPLLGFNANGFRIGYGKGCYDRFFAQNAVKKIGLAFDEQCVEFSPEPHDIALDCCVTQSKVLYFNKCE